MPSKAVRRERRPAAVAGVPAAGWRRLRAALERLDLLPMAGSALPSVATLVAGEPIAGSWWGHPAGRAIYAAACRLAEDPQFVLVKLLDGKDTWVHRGLVPALLAVGRAGEPWQVRDLSAAARALRERLEREGELEASGPAARELQRRLLAVGEALHTPAGRHATRLRTWECWARGRPRARPAPGAAAGRRRLEDAARLLGGAPAVALLPWRLERAAPLPQACVPFPAGQRAATP